MTSPTPPPPLCPSSQSYSAEGRFLICLAGTTLIPKSDGSGWGVGGSNGEKISPIYQVSVRTVRSRLRYFARFKKREDEDSAVAAPFPDSQDRLRINGKDRFVFKFVFLTVFFFLICDCGCFAISFVAHGEMCLFVFSSVGDIMG